MQTTEHYDLGLLEAGDPVSYQDLNANTEKIDAAIAAVPVKHFAVGTYVAQGSPMTVTLGFAPKAVFVRSSISFGFVTTGQPVTDYSSDAKGYVNILYITGNGFGVAHGNNTGFDGITNSTTTYTYMAIG